MTALNFTFNWFIIMGISLPWIDIFHLFDGLFEALLGRNEGVGIQPTVTNSSLQPNSASPIAFAPSSCCFLPSATRLASPFPPELQLPFGRLIGIAHAESRRHSKMWHKPEAEGKIHPRPCPCPGQCGGNRDSLAQSQRHKSNTRK